MELHHRTQSVKLILRRRLVDRWFVSLGGSMRQPAKSMRCFISTNRPIYSTPRSSRTRLGSPEHHTLKGSAPPPSLLKKRLLRTRTDGTNCELLCVQLVSTVGDWSTTRRFRATRRPQ